MAFAKAGAQKIAILGRRTGPLEETKKSIESQVSGVRVEVIHGDVCEADSMRGALGNVKQDLGEIDILVANAGYLPRLESLEEADPDEWWQGFETNVRGAFHLSRAFLSVASKNAVVIDISTSVVGMEAMASATGYVVSKLAATKMWYVVQWRALGFLCRLTFRQADVWCGDEDPCDTCPSRSRLQRTQREERVHAE